VTPFALKLHELCCAEATAAITDPDASSRMTVDLMDQVANAIAVLTQGDRTASRIAAQEMAKALPAMVFEKAAMVRQSKLKLGGQP
jgi:hypothetical protein